MSDASRTPTAGRVDVMDAPRRYAVLLNARARGWTGALHHDVQRYVSAGDLFLTDDFHQARRTVDRLLGMGLDAIFTGGGDGTIMFLVNEIEARIRKGDVPRDAIPPIGVLRLGTGNALAHYLGSDEIMRDLRALRAGAPLSVHRLNMLQSPDGHLAPFAGLGWDAQILNDYNGVKEMVRDTAADAALTGLTGYAFAIASRTLPRALTQPPMRLILRNAGPVARRILYDGTVLEEFVEGDVLYDGPSRICGASTVPYWGFQMRMFPHADDDPKFFQVRCYYGPTRRLLTGLRDTWQGKVREEDVVDLLVERVEVEVQGSPAPYQVSGDAAGFERALTWALTPDPIRLATPMR
ncbi:MAG: diacylglycerol kinase family protein [Myxococcota bacterium]